MRFILQFVVLCLTCCVPVFAQLADRNAGLKVVGTVYNWSVDTKKCDDCWYAPQKWLLTAEIEFKASNEGEEPVLIPKLEGVLFEVRFADSFGSGSNMIVETGKPRVLRRTDSFEPSTNGFRVLDPGTSYRFRTSLKIFVDNRTTSFERFDPRTQWLTFLLNEREAVRELLRRSHLHFGFKMVSPEKWPDALRDLAARWKKFGVLPLNDAGEFFIETPAFESNSYWIKSEDLP